MRLLIVSLAVLALSGCVVATVVDTTATVAGAAVDLTVGTVETAVDIVD